MPPPTEPKPPAGAADPRIRALPALLEALRPLGQGAMATVTLVRLREDLDGVPAGRLLAAKRLLPQFADDPRARQSLRSEAEIGARVRAPTLVEIHGLYEDEAGLVLLEEYVPGRSVPHHSPPSKSPIG